MREVDYAVAHISGKEQEATSSPESYDLFFQRRSNITHGRCFHMHLLGFLCLSGVLDDSILPYVLVHLHL